MERLPQDPFDQEDHVVRAYNGTTRDMRRITTRVEPIYLVKFLDFGLKRDAFDHPEIKEPWDLCCLRKGLFFRVPIEM